MIFLYARKIFFIIVLQNIFIVFGKNTTNNCGGDFTGYQYSIISPNYPNNYSEKQDCIYNLHGNYLSKCDQIFHLEFLNFSIKNSNNCYEDYLKIGDRNFYCGSVDGIRSYIGKNNSLEIRFHSGMTKGGKGFKILVTTAPCANQRNEENYSNITVETSTSQTNMKIAKLTKTSKIDSRNDRFDSNDFYPVYRPEVDIPIEDTKNLESSKPEVSSLKIKIFETNKKFENLSKNLTLPVYKNALFREKNENFQSPNSWRTIFHENSESNFPKNFTITKNHEKSNNFIIPSRSYGIPEPEIKSGEVLENSSIITGENCNEYNENINPNFEVTANFRDNKNRLNFESGSSTGIIYGVPEYDQENDLITGNEHLNGWIKFSKNVISSPEINTGSLECCNTICSSQKCLISNPGFPDIFYTGNPYECIYTIKSFPGICQIRLNFKFFHYGIDDHFCTSGYLEIDGNRICGCKKGLNIISLVSSSFPKIIRVKYTGYPKTKFSGFLIEIIQEPCTGYPFNSRTKKAIKNSTDLSSNLERTKRNLGYFYQKPNLAFQEIPGVSQFWNSGNSGANLFSPVLSCQALSLFDWTVAAKEVYLRGGRCIKNPGIPGNGNWNPGFPGNGGSGSWNPGFPGNGGSGTIPGFPGTGGSGTIPGFPGSGNWNPGYPGNGGSGTIPGFPGVSGSWNPNFPGTGGSGNWNVGFPSTGGSGNWNFGYPSGSGTINPGFPSTGGSGTFPGYPSTGSGSWNFPVIKCDDVNVSEGIISSPQYPLNYPNNVKKCFRFYKAPGSCELELSILDFDLENSAGCTKDYFSFSGQNQRYCGKSLAGSKRVLDISRCNYLDIYFVSDGFGTGRGFNVGFSQIRCRNLNIK